MGAFVYLPSLSAHAAAPALDWNRLTDEAQTEIKRLEGEWHDRRQWKGYLCNGYYEYRTRLKGDVTKVDLELNEKGSVDIHGELVNLHGGATGSYRSDTTLCVPLSGWTGVGIDSAVIEANATFKGTGSSLKDMDIRILKTQLGTIHLGKGVPAWFEQFLTRQVNRTLAVVWRSQLGGWLSQKISDFIKKKIPEDRTALVSVQ